MRSFFFLFFFSLLLVLAFFFSMIGNSKTKKIYEKLLIYPLPSWMYLFPRLGRSQTLCYYPVRHLLWSISSPFCWCCYTRWSKNTTSICHRLLWRKQADFRIYFSAVSYRWWGYSDMVYAITIIMESSWCYTNGC